MLRPSRPMMRPFRSSLGRSTTETVVSIACSAAQRWMASVMYCLRAVGGRLARFGVEPLEQVGGVVPRVAFDLLEQQLRASSAVRPATRSSSCCCSATSCSIRVAAAAARCSRSASGLLAAAQLLLEPLGRAPAARRARASRRASVCSRPAISCRRSARLALGLRGELVRLLLGFEQRFLLAGLGVALGLLAAMRSRLLFGAADGLGGDALPAAPQPRRATPRCDDGRASDGDRSDVRRQRRSVVPITVSSLRRCRGTEVERRKAPLCRVGRSMNLRKAGGTAATSRASGFLATEACTPRGVATHLGETLAQTSLRHHAQSRELKLLMDLTSVAERAVEDSVGAALSGRPPEAPRARAPDRACARARSRRGPRAIVLSAAVLVAAAEALVGDVERGEHRELQRVARGRFARGEPHLLVDEGRQLRHVRGSSALRIG